MCITRHAGSRLQTPFICISPDGEVAVGSLWDVSPFWNLLPGSPLRVFDAAKQLLWGITDFTLHQTVFVHPACRLTLSVIPNFLWKSCFISLDMNNQHQSLLWLLGFGTGQNFSVLFLCLLANRIWMCL